jgi:hypothetical protein
MLFVACHFTDILAIMATFVDQQEMEIFRDKNIFTFSFLF